MTNAEYPQLNLPVAPLRLRMNDERGRCEVFDPRRNRWVTLTPEEWVRQHFVNMLITEKGYYSGRIANEISITLNGTSRRCDTVVFDSYRRPLMIIEYKAPDITLNQAVFDQIVRYNMVLRAHYLAVSNGLNHYCCEIDYESGSARFLNDIPAYDGK